MEQKGKGVQIPNGENAEIWKTLNTLNYAAELQFKALQTNTKLLWFVATMGTIAAINSIDGPSVLYKGMAFMAIGLVGYILSRKYAP